MFIDFANEAEFYRHLGELENEFRMYREQLKENIDIVTVSNQALAELGKIEDAQLLRGAIKEIQKQKFTPKENLDPHIRSILDNDFEEGA